MESYPLPLNGVRWQAERGALALWMPCPTLLVIGIQGHGHGHFAEPILQAYHKLTAKQPIYLFADIEEMNNYDSRLRTELTAAFLADRSRIGALCVLLRSKLVAMGVSVANLALGGIVKIISERPPFKQALDSCLFDNHVVGFSSDVLDSLRVRAAAGQDS